MNPPADRSNELPAVDLETFNALRDSIGDDDLPFLVEIVTDFLVGAPDLIAQMEQGLEANDAQQLTRAAHTLKSTSGTLGAMELAALCKELELRGHAQELAEARGAIERITQALERAAQALNREVKRIESSAHDAV